MDSSRSTRDGNRNRSDRSARRIIPELQNLAPGGIVPMSPNGKAGIAVHSMDPTTSMVWGKPGESTWTWQLDAKPDGSTRLITRVRSRYRWLSPSIALSLLVEFTDIWMMRKMLLNLRDRAEGRQITALDRGSTDGMQPAGTGAALSADRLTKNAP